MARKGERKQGGVKWWGEVEEGGRGGAEKLQYGKGVEEKVE